MNSYISAFLGVLILSLIPLAGLFVLISNRNALENKVKYLVGFAVGALLGNALLHILPEVIESGIDVKYISFAVLAGIFLFYALEQFLRWRHCHEQVSEHHKHPVGVMNQVGDTLHNFIDGILISSAFMVDVSLGWATVFAVIFHEIPQEIADFSVLFYAKWSVKRIVWVNIISAFAAFVGLGVGFWIGNSLGNFANMAVAVTAGGFIYIACTDLIPDLHDNGGITLKQRLLQFLAILSGLGVYLLI